jgi:ABC-type branched-subunit amino acid transport system ATPase component
MGAARRLFSRPFLNRRFGTAIVLVEQNIKTALGMASRAYVMKSGRIVLERPAAGLLARAGLQSGALLTAPEWSW